ncbi:MAG: hypothetical protein AAFW73_19405 [Bacteroidota bacterium]
MKTAYTLLLSLACSEAYPLSAQSLEWMVGNQRLFADIQWLQGLDPSYRWTLFSRTRATVDYEDQQRDLFTGAYLNYTRPSGIGGSLVGRSGAGHVFSVQRIRWGWERGGYQFGLASNLSEAGRRGASLSNNVGLFIRREF